MGDTDTIEELREELSFVVRTFRLADKGHATPPEYKRLREIAERYERFPAEGDGIAPPGQVVAT